MMEKNWKPIDGFDGKYLISDAGEVFNTVTQKIMKCFNSVDTNDRHGHYQLIKLKHLGKIYHRPIHLLVLTAFVGPRPTAGDIKYDCNHKDGDKGNNNLSNLEWITHSENIRHAFKTGLNRSPCLGKLGALNPRARAVVQIDRAGNIVNVFGGMLEAQRKTGIGFTLISHVCRGRYKMAGGYFWKYAKT